MSEALRVRSNHMSENLNLPCQSIGVTAALESSWALWKGLASWKMQDGEGQGSGLRQNSAQKKVSLTLTAQSKPIT